MSMRRNRTTRGRAGLLAATGAALALACGGCGSGGSGTAADAVTTALSNAAATTATTSTATTTTAPTTSTAETRTATVTTPPTTVTERTKTTTTVKPTTSVDATAVQVAPPTTTGDDQDGDDGIPAWGWLLLGLGVVGGAVGLFALGRRRGERPDGGTDDPAPPAA